MATNFPVRARREDPNGHMTVQQMLEFLRDAFDSAMALIVRGSATIGSGATNIVVTHNVKRSSYSAVVTPRVDPTTRYWISNKTSTQFQLNLAAAAPAGGVDFDWIVKGE